MLDKAHLWSPEFKFKTITVDLLLIRGLPGSGKSTLAKNFEEKYKFKHVETDMYFINKETGLYEYDRNKISDAHDWCFDKTISLLNDKNRVVVSNTFTRFDEIERYLNLTENHAIICCIDFYGSDHNVPEEIMHKMKERFEIINGEIYYEL